MATPKQARLPGVEDPAITELEDAAAEYAEIRDERITLSQREGDTKATLLALMHKHKKKHYEHGNVAIDVVSEEETVRVRIKKESEDEEDE